MRIPQQGDSILLVLRQADAGDNQPAIIRSGTILSVGSYSPTGASVNAAINLDGSNDERYTRQANILVPDSALALQGWATSILFDSEGAGKTGTWTYAPATYSRIDNFTVRGPITHGREVIRKGAVGTYDESRNLIMFDPKDISGLHPELMPHYTADVFIDLHSARLQAPAGCIWVNQTKERTDDSERPDEREQMVRDIRERDLEIELSRFSRLANMLSRRMGLPEMEEIPMPSMMPWQWPTNFKTRSQMRDEHTRSLQRSLDQGDEQLDRLSGELDPQHQQSQTGEQRQRMTRQDNTAEEGAGKHELSGSHR